MLGNMLNQSKLDMAMVRISDDDATCMEIKNYSPMFIKVELTES